MFKKLGYQRLVDFEYAPEWAAQHGVPIETPEANALLLPA
jgi:hypothetical protein